MSRFLLLQGNATPFWASLGRGLASRGHDVAAIYLNFGDHVFGRFASATSFRGNLASWPRWLSDFLDAKTPDIIVLFGRYRPHHLPAVALAQARGITVWNFDEGYWRPGYVTCEKIVHANTDTACLRGKPIGHATCCAQPPVPLCPPGRFAERAAFDVAYHVLRAVCQPLYPFYQPHHHVDPFVEYMAFAPSLLLNTIQRYRGRKVLLRMEATCAFLYPMQLEGDFQVRVRSTYSGNLHALAVMMASFARNAPGGAILVIKAHPLDPALMNWGRQIRRLAMRFNLSERVIFFHTDELERAVRACRGVITINSTVGTLGLALGKPVLALGHALYRLPGLVHMGDIDTFWMDAETPDPALVDTFRRWLTRICVIPGDYFSRAGRELAVRAAIDRMNAQVTDPSMLRSTISPCA